MEQFLIGFGLRGFFLSFTIMTTFYSSSFAKTCSNYDFTSNKVVFSACNDLHFLNSFLHYTYNPSSKTLKIAYRHTNIGSSQWVAWAINPTSRGMVGSQAIVAFQQSDGKMKVYTSPVTGYSTQLREGDLSFPVSELSATYTNNEMIIFATLGMKNMSSDLNQVWQDGQVSRNSPMPHSTTGDNIKCMGTINVLSGQSYGSAPGGAGSKTKKRNIHGLLNTISWGIMMPVGAIMARYVRVFESGDPAWFYLHVTCQTSAYIIGVAGWATGIRLGSQSPGVQFTSHRIIGIILFCVATLQVIALLVRPKKDHKYRVYWNIYHHSLGYAIIILGIINIFKGFGILNPNNNWKTSYVGTIIFLAILALVFETYTWFLVLKRKKAAKNDKSMTNCSNDCNGYGAVTNGSI